MLSYMKCLKANKNNSGACRPEARDYLGCRMDNELMGRDEWSNLGLGDVPATAAKSEPTPAAATATASSGSAGPSSGGSGRYVPSERI
jgi:cytochrome c oxidase assembly protein subunit 19